MLKLIGSHSNIIKYIEYYDNEPIYLAEEYANAKGLLEFLNANQLSSNNEKWTRYLFI
jgi:hypothetical protein